MLYFTWWWKLKKYKYQRLTKEEKKKIKTEFYKTAQGNDLKVRFKRIMIYSIILIIFGLYLLIEAIIKDNSYAQYVYASILILFGIGFISSKYYVEMRKINDFLTLKKHK